MGDGRTQTPTRTGTGGPTPGVPTGTAVAIKPAVKGAARGLRVGDRVEVRSPEDILSTLDGNGELDALPFMPEMLQYCGKQFTVDKVAHKLCDTVSSTGMRRMRDAVHLAGVRCDGDEHGGCQAGCLIYWKDAWLRRVPARRLAPASPPSRPRPQVTLGDLYDATRRPPALDGADRFSCQATELPRAAPELVALRNVRPHVDDVRSGNVGVGAVARALLVGLFDRLQALSSQALPPRLRFRGGRPWGAVVGTAGRAPTAHTRLLPGDLARVRSRAEIARTLGRDGRNQGLGFGPEMTRHCGREARVIRRVERRIDEGTCRMLHLPDPAIVLDGVVCDGACTANCPRSMHALWREIWLERVPEPEPVATSAGPAATGGPLAGATTSWAGPPARAAPEPA